jgi:hypothetical protein
LVQAFLKKWWVESDFKAPNLPLSLRFKELSEIESEVDRLTRQVNGYERFGQSIPKYMATGERQSVGFPVDSGFATT